MVLRVAGPNTAEIHTTTTSGSSAYVALSPATVCRAVTIFNTSGADLLVKRNTQAAVTAPDLGRMRLPNGSSRTFTAITSAEQLSIKREDNGAAVVVDWEAEGI
jgi:hypothetical protein